MVVWTFAVEYFWCLLWQFCHQQPLKQSSHRKEYTIYDRENRRGNPEKPATLETGRRQTKQNTQHNTEKLLMQIMSMTMHQIIIIWPIKPISVFYILNKCCSDLTIYICIGKLYFNISRAVSTWCNSKRLWKEMQMVIVYNSTIYNKKNTHLSLQTIEHKKYNDIWRWKSRRWLDIDTHVSMICEC
jgi:hypothetical protein